MRHIITITLLFYLSFSLAQNHRFEGTAGGYFLDNVKTNGISFLMYSQPDCNCGKWPKRFNLFLGADLSLKENGFKGGTMITLFHTEGFNLETIRVAVIPFYLNYSIEQKGYNTPIGIYLELFDKPIAVTLFSSWYKDRASAQVMLSYKFGTQKIEKL